MQERDELFMKKEFEDEDDDLEMIDLEETDSRSASPSAEEDYEEEDEDEDEEDEDDGKAKYFHIALLSTIVILIISAAIILIRWNQGSEFIIDIDPNENYDVESEDYRVDFNPNRVEGYVDDGVQNIVILGDSSIAHCTDETGIAALIAEKTGANVTALALPESTIALQEPSYTIEYAEDAFNLYYVGVSICGGEMGDYSLLFSALSNIENNGDYYNYWDALHVIDFDTVDTLIISYGVEDYIAARPLIGEEVYSQQIYGLENSVAGALDDVIELLQQRFPYMQIIVSSPSFCLVEDEDGNFVGGDTHNTGIGTLGDYVVNMKYVAMQQSVAFVDNYFLPNYNASDYESYLEENGRYPNAEGREIIADHIVEFIYQPETTAQ